MSNDTFELLFVGTLPPHRGGSAVCAAEHLVRLAQRGFRVRAIAPITRAELAAGDAFAKAHPKIAVDRFEVPLHDMNSFQPDDRDYLKDQTRAVGDKLRAAIAKRRPDAILVGRESFIWGMPALAAEQGIACALLAQGLILAVLAGNYPSGLGRRLWDEFARADLIVAVARHMARTLERHGFDRVAAVPNGIDPVHLRPGPKHQALAARIGIEASDQVVVHVSNFNPLKRLGDVVTSAAMALKSNPRLLYVLVGDGIVRAETEAAVRSGGLEPRFRFTGWIDREDVWDYLRLADLVLLTSETEALAYAYLEAQATARVLLASDLPAAREVIAEGRTGLLYPVGDVAALATKTLAAIADPTLRERIGKAARAAVVEKHHVEHAADALAELLQALRVDRLGGAVT